MPGLALSPEQHMREVAERRQQLELEHEQALAILKFKQDEIKRLQRVRTTASLCHLQIYFLQKLNHQVLVFGNGGLCPAGGNLWAPMKHHMKLCCELEFYEQTTNVTVMSF